jgi:hypothetical protein
MNLIFFFPILLFAIVCSIWIYLLLKSNSKDPSERGLAPLYHEQCVGYFDGLRRIFVRFAAYEDFLVISYSRKIILPYGQIRSVKKETFFLRTALHIYHGKAGLPDIVLLLKRTDFVRKVIESKLSMK